jgi:hypothetical protein
MSCFHEYTTLTTAITNAETLLAGVQAALTAATAELAAASIDGGLAGPNINQSSAGGSFAVDRVGYLSELRQRMNSLTLDTERLTNNILELSEMRQEKFPFFIQQRMRTPGGGSGRVW